MNEGSDEYNGFSIAHMDPAADPWNDFYTYSVGNWVRSNPVPSDKSHWGSFEILRENNDRMLRGILEECSASSDSAAGIVKQLGDFFKSALDTAALENAKFAPVRDYMNLIDGTNSKEELLKTVVELHRRGIFVFFRPFSRSDKKNSSIYALYFYQGGLALPNKDYYVLDSFSELRKHYREHISRVFTMYGIDAKKSAELADSVFSIENDLANSSRSQTELRDAEKNYNRISTSEIDAMYPALKLTSYMETMGVPKVEFTVAGQPEFFRSLSDLISSRSLDELKAYLRWQVLNAAAPYLFSGIEDEHFDMFNRKIRGQQEPEPRWKRATRVIDQFMGEALGKLYAEKYFGKESRERMATLIENVKEVFRDRLKNLDWMTDDTKKQALEKFGRFRAKIGHPEKFRDYSAIGIRKDDYFGNVCRCASFEVERQAGRVGSDVDRNEWFMTPPTVNAYFSPPDNEIVFPAGILQPPFFDVSADDAVNYGAIGAVISHEITHGYDDQGRRYDQDGNLRDWWTSDDKENFLRKANMVVEEYSSIEVLPGLHINGELTLGENIADFGGISLSYEALQRQLQKHPELRKEIDGLTPEQRFFISWAQVWRDNMKEQELRMRVSVDPHSPNKYRATVPVLHHPDFEKAFPRDGESKGNALGKEKITVW